MSTLNILAPGWTEETIWEINKNLKEKSDTTTTHAGNSGSQKISIGSWMNDFDMDNDPNIVPI